MARRHEKTRSPEEDPRGLAGTASQPEDDVGDVPDEEPVGDDLDAGLDDAGDSDIEEETALDGARKASPRARRRAVAAEAVAGEAAAFWTATGDLHPWKANPRWKDKKKFKKAVRLLMRSIRRFGFGAPMLARKANGEIIAGHTRWAAAKRLGLKVVAVRFMDLSEEEAHAHALGDNRTAEYGEWHPEKLAAAIEDLESKDVDLNDGLGFEEDELDEILVGGDDDFDLDEFDGDDGGKKSNNRGLKYQLLVECTGEEDQALLLEQLEAAGRKCKPLMS